VKTDKFNSSRLPGLRTRLASRDLLNLEQWRVIIFRSLASNVMFAERRVVFFHRNKHESQLAEESRVRSSRFTGKPWSSPPVSSDPSGPPSSILTSSPPLASPTQHNITRSQSNTNLPASSPARTRAPRRRIAEAWPVQPKRHGRWRWPWGPSKPSRTSPVSAAGTARCGRSTGAPRPTCAASRLRPRGWHRRRRRGGQRRQRRG
jgi:hypothetical protein